MQVRGVAMRRREGAALTFIASSLREPSPNGFGRENDRGRAGTDPEGRFVNKRNTENRRGDSYGE
jgi:hypothetical protein